MLMRECYPNLKIHNANYPTPEYLKSKIRMGNVDFDGDYSKDTPGSELIKQVLLDDNDEQVFLLAWGGASTIARALKSIEDIYSGTSEWESIKAKVSHKGILSLSGDQDDTYAKYIKPFWPDMEQMQGGGMTVGTCLQCAEHMFEGRQTILYTRMDENVYHWQRSIRQDIPLLGRW